MISRVIEARPEELRGFLEEAAGISKYKERRRETENRMRHARENIERLDDIREELAKQLSHLQRQARAAERYQVLKGEERQLNAKLLAARRRSPDGERKKVDAVNETRKTELEAEVARLREVEAHQASYRETQVAATEKFNTVQADFYARSGDIARLEQSIRHDDDRARGLQQDLTEATKELENLVSGVTADITEVQNIATELAEIEPGTQTARADEEKAYAALQASEQKLAQWQTDWDSFNRAHSELAQADHAAQIRLEHLLNDVAGHDSRKSVLAEEASRNDTSDLSAQISELSATPEQLSTKKEALLAQRNTTRNN